MVQDSVDETTLKEIITTIIQTYPEQREQYKQGKHALLQFFVGQVMKATKGKADAQQASLLCIELLGEIMQYRNIIEQKGNTFRI